MIFEEYHQGKALVIKIVNLAEMNGPLEHIPMYLLT